MKSIRGKPDQNVASLYILSTNDLVAVYHANNKTGEVVFSIRIKARHLSGFAADQGAAIMLAAVDNTRYDLLGHLRLEVPTSQIVHEEHRSSTLHGNVIYAMVHQVGADGMMQAHFEGELELGANAIHARNQHRIAIFLLVDRKQPPEAANLAKHPAIEGFVRQVLDALFGAIGAVNVNTGIGVGDRAGLCRLLCQKSGSHPGANRRGILSGKL